MVAQTWDEFLKNEFKNKLDKATLNGPITDAQVRELIIGSVNNLKHTINPDISSFLAAGEHSTRADNLRVTQKADVNNTNSRQGPDVELEVPVWRRGFDGIDVPNRVSNTNKDLVLNSFNQQVESLRDAVNEFKKTYKARPSIPAPRPSKKIEPRP